MYSIIQLSAKSFFFYLGNDLPYRNTIEVLRWEKLQMLSLNRYLKDNKDKELPIDELHTLSRKLTGSIRVLRTCNSRHIFVCFTDTLNGIK